MNPQPAVLETAALPIELLAYEAHYVSIWLAYLPALACSQRVQQLSANDKDTLLGLAMQAMTLASRTVLADLHATGLVAPVLAGEIVALFALGAGQSYKNAIAFLCHVCLRLLLVGKQGAGARPAPWSDPHGNARLAASRVWLVRP